MKYLFISDAHGDRAILQKIFQANKEAVTQIFYNGDSELPADDSVFDGVITVAGNMDFDRKYESSNHYRTSDQSIFQAHGHLFGVNYSLTKLILAAKAVDAQIVTFGHTHQLGVEVVDNMLVINPGSISQPRGQYAYLGGTYAIVTVNGLIYDVQYYDRQMTAIPDLHFTFNLTA
ncbi:YfcE family phosphodiesterase [Periweissella ghanensis]|uniref:Phosphoesterase n=1 Tax=Periweissella ghanensis TaxID=467997 RepID=A0ABN8BS48_9LACO|nr:metallophosphoesterase [Periweissella ghanensis]CAH0419034.1 hypothetical protein WGH24286_01481 [Periweissella ghanensis]